jgi:helicase
MQRLIDNHNLPEEIVDIWRQEEGETLLDLQVKAIEEFGLLEGNSLLVTAPSSSGKTFVGEMAAVNSYFKGKKTIFLVPMKAIAEEKYADFVRKYQNFGINIVVSTHDRTEFDESILAGYFDIAIIIFEKMNVLLTQSSAVLNSCGLIVVDELQILNDRTRGADLEILLTKIKMVKDASPDCFQFLGLSAVLADLNRFDEWLGAVQCGAETRPLELHEGVLQIDGTIKFRNFNDGHEYNDTAPTIPATEIPRGVPQNREQRQQLEESIQKRLVLLCRHYLAEGKRILIFRKWRPLARDTAQRLAQELNLPPATNAIQALGDSENTNSKEMLVQSLTGGVAFHNSDLPPEARLTIESDFRQVDGQIQVVCSTSTLAIGVNLPASVVIIPDTMKPDPAAEEFHEIPITAAEYKNMAGRAGRTRFREEGISLLLTNSGAEAMRYWQSFVRGRLDRLTPPLERNDLRKIMLGLFAGNMCRSQDDIANLLLSSYTGYVHWNSNPKTREPFIKRISDNIIFLQRHRLLENNNEGGFTTTPLGSLCASSGVEVESFVLLQHVVENIDPTSWDPWELIFACLHCREISDLLRITFRAPDRNETWQRLEALDPGNRERLCEWSRQTSVVGSQVDLDRRIQVSLLLNDWINCTDMREIENRYAPGGNRFLSGIVQRIAETVAWMMDTIRRIAFALKYDAEFVNEVRVLSERLIRGIQAEGIELHKLGVRGVNRMTVKRMVDAGYSSLDHILDTPAEDFRGTINPRTAQRIHEEIIRRLGESQERAKHNQASRLEKHGRDPHIIRAIYELDGTALEHAVVDLLNSPPLELAATRIAKQREGEPDILLPLSGGILVGSVTASRTNVSDGKCVEIVRSGARFNPTAYAVFGRPGFHDLAVRNAPNINNTINPNTTYKLISIQELGELFVRVVEDRITSDAFVDTLMNRRNLILADDVHEGQGD